MSINKTLTVVSASKLIERFASSSLSLLLDIDLKTSKTLGNKSTAFSFKQKLDLLTDIKAFDKKELPKFQIFTEVRNQFAHNFKVYDYETCFSFIDGGESFLKKQYTEITDKEKTHEDYLFELFKKLFSNIISICGNIIQTIEAKITKDVGEKLKREMYEKLIVDVKSYAEDNPEFGEFYNKSVDKLVEKKDPE